MAWYYYLNGGNQGPVELAELQRLHERSVVLTDTPVWTEGMAQWEPYQTSSAVALSTVPGTSHGVTHACAECGKIFSEDEMLQYENSWVCAACKPIFFQKIKEGVAPRGMLVLASLWKRLGAVFIDGIFIGVVLMILLVPVFFVFFQQIAAAAKDHAANPAAPALPVGMMLYFYVVELVLPAAYEIFFIGKYGATLGKMLLKVKVVSADGSPISYGRSTGRYFAKILSGMILYVGYLMAFWDDEKRGLHDRICRTRVIATDAS